MGAIRIMDLPACDLSNVEFTPNTELLIITDNIGSKTTVGDLYKHI